MFSNTFFLWNLKLCFKPLLRFTIRRNLLLCFSLNLGSHAVRLSCHKTEVWIHISRYKFSWFIKRTPWKSRQSIAGQSLMSLLRMTRPILQSPNRRKPFSISRNWLRIIGWLFGYLSKSQKVRHNFARRDAEHQ